MAIRFIVQWVLGLLGRVGTSGARARGRAADARAALYRVRGRRSAARTLAPGRNWQFQAALPQCEQLVALLQPFVAHGWLIAFVLVVATGDAVAGWSAQLTTLPPEAVGQSTLRADVDPPGQSARMPGRVASVVQLRAFASEPVAPALRAPVELVGAFRTIHQLEAGESLGSVAARYGVSLASLVWANGLEHGDALIIGQPLRIPRVSGIAYMVATGDTVAGLAERFGVSIDAILTFAPNQLANRTALLADSEIFVPGGIYPMPEFLLARGGEAGLAERVPEPAGIVLAAQTNLRAGPGTDYPRQAQLDVGRQVALRARHTDWLLVEISGVQGWVRADMLRTADGLVAALPETNDFPPPPPIWVWPTRGTITSPFGARWGSFHNGLDIANRAWTPIVAARAGQVREAGWCRGYGYCVKINHGGGIETIYGHMIDQPSVAAGDQVSAGDVIGYMGSTYDRAGGGYSTGVHLHFTITVNGQAVDPLKFLP